MHILVSYLAIFQKKNIIQAKLILYGNEYSTNIPVYIQQYIL